MLLPAITALAANAILLLAMVAVIDLVTATLRSVGRWHRDVALGLLLGMIGVAIMAAPFQEAPGIQFDTRSVLLAVMGLYLGVVPTVIAMAMTMAVRVQMGGSALLMGIATIISSGTIGLIWHGQRRARLAELKWAELLAVGMAVHIAMLLWTGLLPLEDRHRVRDVISIPVLIVYPIATMVLALMLRDRLRRDREFVALKAAEERLALALSAGGQGIYDLDIQTGDAIVSPEYASMLGYDPATFRETNATWLERLHPEDRDHVASTYREYIAGRRSEYRVEFRQRTVQGHWLWIRSVGRISERDPDGSPRRMLGTHTDISEHKADEESTRLQLAALDAAADAIVIVDRDGIIRWCNDAFTSLTGYAREEVIGFTPRLLKSGVQEEPFYKELWQTLLQGKVWRGELVNRRKDRTEYVEQQSITPFRNPHGVITHFVAIKRDLTAQHQLEAQYQQAQKMESVGRLAGSVAHDFNNLLTVINSSIDLAKSALSPDHPSRLDLDEADRAAARAVLLTRQLLGFSRQRPSHVTRLDLSETVRGMLPMLDRLLGENIAVVASGCGPVPAILADRGQMEQVVMNLTINARDAMPAGGTITITTASLPAHGDDAEHWVELRIRDTGTGMDAQTQSRLFEPFFTTKEPGKGTGLGLATVFSVVSMAKGRITVETAPGRGSTFVIHLPAADPGEAAPTVVDSPTTADPIIAEQPALRGSAGQVILVVEDEEAIRRVLRRVLERNHYTVLEAANGDEALDIIAEQGATLSLMITDMMMPGMTGGELVAQLQQRHSTVPVILTSGYSAEFTRERAGVGAEVTFVSKPFAIDELVRTVRTVLAATA
jgi:PAS domain S-box-containing protein